MTGCSSGKPFLRQDCRAMRPSVQTCSAQIPVQFSCTQPWWISCRDIPVN